MKRVGLHMRIIMELIDMQPRLPADASLTACPIMHGYNVSTAAQATATLRHMLRIIGILNASEFALHSGRVGATIVKSNGGTRSACISDLQLDGENLLPSWCICGPLQRTPIRFAGR